MDLIEYKSSAGRHPWETSRGKSICRVLARLLNQPTQLRIADIGAGDRYVTGKIKDLSERHGWGHHLICVDSGYTIAEDGLESGGLGIYREMKPEWAGTFHLVLLLDVAEHIEDDLAFFDEVRKILTDEGVLLITAPAFPSLYSAHDMHLKHYRRYRRRELIAKLEEKGFRIESNHYFFTPLLLVRLVQRFTTLSPSRHVKITGLENWPFSERHVISRIVVFVLDTDFRFHEWLGRRGLVIPGLSILIKAYK